jgi:competence protein ComEC
MKRPALITGLFFILGILTAHFVDIPVFYLFLATSTLFLVCMTALVSGKSEILWIQILLLTTVVLGGAFRYELSTRHFPANHISNLPYFDDNIILEGQIVSEPRFLRGRTKITLGGRRISSNGLSTEVCGKILVAFKEGIADTLAYGDVIRVKGRLRNPPPAKNPGAFNYQRHLLRLGIFGLLWVSSPEDIELVEKAGNNSQHLYGLFISKVIFPIRRTIHKSIDRNLLGTPAAVLKGILLGDKRGLPAQVKAAFADAGVIHILAVSGLHVGLVVAIFFSLFRLLCSSNKWTTLATLSALFLYAFVTDLRPSVVRASIMATVILVGLGLERDSDIINNLALAALIILLIWPQALFDAGFQLSFAATIAIVSLYWPILSLFPQSLTRQDRWWGRWVFGVVALSIAAQLGVAPITAFYFNRLPLISILANIVAIPTLGAVLALGFVASAFGFWCTPVAMVFNAANWLFLKFLLKTVQFFASLPYGTFHVSSPSWFFFLGYFSVLALLMGVQSSIRARRVLLFFVLVVANIYLWKGIWGDSRQLRVVFLSPGRGNAAFVHCPNGRKILIDAGPRTPYFDAGKTVICPFLHRSGVRKVDAVIVTHQDNSHIGGLISVLENFRVDNILDNGQPLSSWTSDRLWEIAYWKGVRHWTISAGDTLAGLGEVKVMALAPARIPDSFPERSSQAPVILKLTYKGTSFLITGGLEWKDRKELFAWGDELKATVLETGRLDTQTTLGKKLLQTVSPQVLILTGSSGDSSWREELGDAVGSTGRLYQIEKNGAVTVIVDRRGRMKITSMLANIRD